MSLLARRHLDHDDVLRMLEACDSQAPWYNALDNMI